MAALMSDIFVSIREKSFPAPDSAGSRPVLQKVAFYVRRGEFVAIVGPSGCGKTTLFNIIAGLDTDFSGDIDLGEVPGGAPPRIGYVFQAPRLLPWRTVWENIALVLPRRTDPAVIDDLLREIGLADARDVFASRLSVGMSRRVAIARAFAIRPDLLLMDEPFVSIDERRARRMRRLLLSLWRAHPTSVLFVTHDLREAVSLADRVLFLSSAPGRLLGDFPVPLSRVSRDDENAIEAARRALYAIQDRLLSGTEGRPVAGEADSPRE